jgi:glycosyltransferase involved in cell wall biosynthesis
VRQWVLNWISFRYIAEDGYGRYGMHCIRALNRAGADIRPFDANIFHWPGWLRLQGGLNTANLTIALMPAYELDSFGGRAWCYSMFEGTGLEERWQRANKTAERMLVPHEFLVDVMRKNGIRIPIHVVPGGTCPAEFPVIERSPFESGKPYTFLALADRAERKGWDMVWGAFHRAFGLSRDVRLIVKARGDALSRFTLSDFDRRVSFWTEATPNMVDVYDQADCFVFPTRGEGWGMPPREFAMTGKPTIVTRWSGVEDGIDQYALPLNHVKMVPANLRGGGEWAFPDIDEIAEKMRWCYDHRDEARAHGLKAAQWLRANQTWDHTAKRLLELVEEYE